MSEFLYDVFLSHCSADKPAVEELARRLVDAGISVFLDKWHLVPGEPWQEALEDALSASQTIAVFVGSSDISPWDCWASFDPERARPFGPWSCEARPHQGHQEVFRYRVDLRDGTFEPVNMEPESGDVGGL